MREAHDPVQSWLNAARMAFATCEKPRSEQHLVSVGGIDAGDAMDLWSGLDRDAVANHPDFDFNMGTYLDYLSSDGMRYFLPALLELALVRPAQIDDYSLSFLVSRMENMWVKAPDYRFYRGTTLTKPQVDVVARWCELMGQQTEGLDLYDINDYQRIDCSRSIQGLIGHLPSALVCPDYDADYRKELSGGETGERTGLRRHGWQQFKNKKGKRPRE